MSASDSNPTAAATGNSASDNITNAARNSFPTERILYPYSVVPGGVENAQELKTAIHNDSVVSVHYADFNIANARVISLDRDRDVYVSYRMGGQMFWTKRPLLLHKGESLITDGFHEARTRCGNRISETPQAPVSFHQPAPETLDWLPNAELSPTPFSPPLANTEHEIFALLVNPSAAGLGFMPGPGTNLPLVQGSRISVGSLSYFGSAPGPSDPPVSTPEPSTLLLLSGGLSVLWSAYTLRRITVHSDGVAEKVYR
jgi:hypothetical protein